MELFPFGDCLVSCNLNFEFVCCYLQVEYLPISSMEKAQKVMEEFLEIWNEALAKRSLPGKFVNIDLNFGEFGLGDIYTPQHTAVRYALVMAHMIATVQAVRG